MQQLQQLRVARDAAVQDNVIIRALSGGGVPASERATSPVDVDAGDAAGYVHYASQIASRAELIESEMSRQFRR